MKISVSAIFHFCFASAIWQCKRKQKLPEITLLAVPEAVGSKEQMLLLLWTEVLSLPPPVPNLSLSKTMYVFASEINVTWSAFSYIWMYSTAQQLQSPHKSSGDQKGFYSFKGTCTAFFLMNTIIQTLPWEGFLEVWWIDIQLLCHPFEILTASTESAEETLALNFWVRMHLHS